MDAIKIARLEAGIGLARVAVDRVAYLHDRLALPLNRADESGEVLAQLFGAHAHDDGELPGNVLGIQGGLIGKAEKEDTMGESHGVMRQNEFGLVFLALF